MHFWESNQNEMHTFIPRLNFSGYLIITFYKINCFLMEILNKAVV